MQTKFNFFLKQFILIFLSILFISGNLPILAFANPYPNNLTNPLPVAVGIDVSKYNKNKIDWNAVKEAGFSFAIIKISKRNPDSEISDLVDEKFEEFYEGAGAAGIKRGVYVFNYASDVEEAELEAEACLETLAGRPLELPIAYDIENYSSKTRNKLTKKGKTVTAEAINAFCDIVEEAGYQSMIYTSTHYIKKYIDYDMISDRKLWLARYPKISKNPSYQDYMNYKASEFPYYIWQFSSLAYVPTASYTSKSKGKTIHHCDVNFIYDPAFANEGIETLRYKTLQGKTIEEELEEYDKPDNTSSPNNTNTNPIVPPNDTITPTALFFQEPYINLDANNINTYQLNLSVFPAEASTKTIKFISSDTEIADVDNNGVLTPKKSGSVTITASSGFLNATTTINITKDIIKPTSLKLSNYEVLMAVEDTFQLNATVTPDNNPEPIQYSSSDPSVVSVNKKGKLTALEEGEAVITATVGTLSEECEILVIEKEEENSKEKPEKASETKDKKDKKNKKDKKKNTKETKNKQENISSDTTSSSKLNIIRSSVKMGINEVYKFELRLDKSINKDDVTWQSSDINIISGYDSGVMTAKAKGTVILTAKLKSNPDIKDTVKVTVVDNPKAIKLDKKTISLKKGSTYKLKPKFSKGGASAGVTYASSNSKIAKVSKNGNIKAIAKGSVTITLTTHNKKTTSIKVVVK